MSQVVGNRKFRRVSQPHQNRIEPAAGWPYYNRVVSRTACSCCGERHGHGYITDRPISVDGQDFAEMACDKCHTVWNVPVSKPHFQPR